MKRAQASSAEIRGTRRYQASAVIYLVIFLLISTVVCKAQLATTGTIEGTVLDQSGAAVPGAAVTITNVGTRTVTQTVSNSAGRFFQVGLESGNYEITISASGFASFKETSFYLEPTGTYTVNAVLKPGGVATTVTVSGNPTQAQTTTSEVSSTISSEEAEALPLNGRNYQGLASLMPGVINTTPVAAMGTGGYLTDNSIDVNGAGTGGSLYTIDGVWNLDTVEHNQNTIIPNPDEIAEIKVLQNNYSAKYTLLGTGVIMVQTKSGTDTFHGGAWEFLRNTFLDTRNYFVPASTGISPEEWNIFGWDLGGPLYIPKIYNTGKNKKTFFYFNQQWVRQKQEGVVTGATPTALIRAGTFPLAGSGSPYLTSTNGGWLKDPTKTGTCSAASQTACFPKNQIPANRIDQNALTLLNALANAPNNQTGAFNNYVNTNPTLTDQMDIEAKLDQDFSPKLRLTAEYFNEGNTSDSPNASRMGSPFSTNYDVFDSTDQVLQIRLTQILSSSMTNQTSIAMSNLVENHDFGGIRLLSQLPSFHQVLPYTGGFLQNYLPYVSISGGWSAFGASSCCIVPRATSLYDTVADDWGWLRGKHFIEAGFTYVLGHDRQWNAGGPLSNGTFAFNGLFTGNPMADYLLGDTDSFGQGNTAFRKYMHYPIVSPYVEDQWKATQRLTITAGLRWFYMPWTSTQAGTSASFDSALFNPANAPIVSTTGVITPTPNYNPGNGMIINGQNGVPLNLTTEHQYYLAPVLGFALDVFGNGRTALRGGYGITYDKATEDGCGQACVNPPLLQSVNLINANFSNPTGAAPGAVTAQGTTGVDLHNYRAAQVQSFSLSWEQDFPGNWLMTIAGAGDVTTHEPISVAGPIFPLGQPAPDPPYNFNPLINLGTDSNSYFSPYQGYLSVGMYSSIFIANWFALEASLRHPVGHNLYLTAAYTWSHNLDNLGGWINPYEPQTAYGNSTANGDTPQVFTLSGIYSLPAVHSGWKHYALGGWKYSDMTTIQSGSYESIGVSGSGFGLATRPNITGIVTYPKNWKIPNGAWFNTSVFSKPAAGYYGNVGNGTILGPGLINFDMAAYKDFPITERAKLEFRSEFFNVFNHTNPNNPTATYGSATDGEITSAKSSRIGELSLKLRF